MSQFKQYLREYAERELELIGFMETEFGESCLKFLADLAEISGDNSDTMKTVLEMIPRLIDKKPLSPITENDFEIETHTQGDKTIEIERCTRYPYLYKKDGKYWDDRAVAFQRENADTNERLYFYQSNCGSKQEVELPYFPQDCVRKI